MGHCGLAKNLIIKVANEGDAVGAEIFHHDGGDAVGANGLGVLSSFDCCCDLVCCECNLGLCFSCFPELAKDFSVGFRWFICTGRGILGV